ncbi:hypothetical protein FOPG_14195 [Fusarium oxysporum f. sp. conglutinans race 2 54008]|uniref:Uncharacterized protein n=1 Tax=Fusarium oxysporum f. sp. conglutinans race 2 54008 TaxID=1089457 RepID=X0H1X5_FUSOX|nr:hypothetical protein FOPG_14195 [Fusarium oxysporum f. sp. conglutinans race 2 54008]
MSSQAPLVTSTATATGKRFSRFRTYSKLESLWFRGFPRNSRDYQSH